MSRRVLGPVVPAICMLVMSSVAPSTAQTMPSPIESVGWLRGCWELRTSKRTVEECWMRPSGGSMLGTSRTVSGGSLSGYEWIILLESGSSLTYEARPSGQPGATFVSVTLSDSLIVFENPEHDFPQRIGYRRVGADSLAAWIEGSIDGETRRVDFPYGRIACEQEQ